MPVFNLTVASLRFDVYQSHVTAPDTRLAFVTRCVRELGRRYHTGRVNERMILTGPEYMFARKNYTLSEFNRKAFKNMDVTAAPTGRPGARPGEFIIEESDDEMEEGLDKRRKTPYSEKEKKAIIKELRGLSKAYPQMLMLPGTIMWREYLYFKKATGRKSPVYNTAPVLANGKEVHLYNKKNPSDEIKVDYRLRGGQHGDQADRYRFVPGTKSGLFEWNGIRCGIEICADHAGTLLKKEINGAGGVDLHFMLSAGMSADGKANCAKTGGFLISNDGSCEARSQELNLVQAGGILSPQRVIAEDPEWRVWTTALTVA